VDIESSYGVTGVHGDYLATMAAEFESLERSLEKHLPASELAEVQRILYGKQLR